MDQDPSAASRYAADLRRTVDRAGGLGLPRLAAAFAPEHAPSDDPGRTRADAVRLLTQRLADLAADLEGAPRRVLPRLGDQAVGDQLAVCGQDLLAAAGPADGAVLTAAAELLLDLRRRL